MNNRLVNFFIIVPLIISILIFFYLHSETINLFRNNHYINSKIYNLFLISIIFWTIILFCKYSIKKIIIYFFYLFMISLYIIEVFGFYLQKQISNSDLRNQSEVYFDYVDNNIEILPSVSPINHFNSEKSIFPLSSLSSRKTFTCNESGEWPLYQTDKYGFLNLDEDWEFDNLDILLIGDSIIYGECVNQNESISNQLKKYTDKSIISLGQSGVGSLIELGFFREYGSGYKPKKVFWFYYTDNDLRNISDEENENLLINYLQPDYSQDLINKQNLIDEMNLNLIKNQFKYKNTKTKINNNLRSFITLSKTRAMFNLELGFFYDVEKNSENIKTLENILIEVTSSVNNYEGELYFVIVPSYYSYNKFTEKINIFNIDEINLMIDTLKINKIDLTNQLILDQDPDTLFVLGRYNHYTPEGYNKISRIIEKYIDE